VDTGYGRRRVDVMPNDKNKSGYVPCDCRDCMDTTIFSVETPSFCGPCEEAGCELNEECCRPDAYGAGDGDHYLETSGSDHSRDREDFHSDC
jgi:hypothetical protein